MTFADTDALRLLVECHDTLWLLMEPVFPDEVPSDAAIAALHERVSAFLIDRCGPDPGYVLAIADRPA